MNKVIVEKSNTKNFWMFKAPWELKAQLDKIRLERIKSGKDSEMRTYNRLGLAMSRSDKLINELVNADFLEGNKNARR